MAKEATKHQVLPNYLTRKKSFMVIDILVNTDSTQSTSVFNGKPRQSSDSNDEHTHGETSNGYYSNEQHGLPRKARTSKIGNRETSSEIREAWPDQHEIRCCPTRDVDEELRSTNTMRGKRVRKARTAFTDRQLTELERSFEKQKYLAVQDRIDLASRLGLSDMQVKTWYQNRRTKWKRQTAFGLEFLAEADNMTSIGQLMRYSAFLSPYLCQQKSLDDTTQNIENMYFEQDSRSDERLVDSNSKISYIDYIRMCCGSKDGVPSFDKPTADAHVQQKATNSDQDRESSTPTNHESSNLTAESWLNCQNRVHRPIFSDMPVEMMWLSCGSLQNTNLTL